MENGDRLREILGFIELGRRLRVRLESESLEPGSAIYEALKLVASGHATVESGRIHPNLDRDVEETRKRINELRGEIEDEVVSDYLMRYEISRERIKESCFLVGDDSFNLPYDFYLPNACLYVAVGKPEMAEEFIRELEYMDDYLRGRQVIEMAEASKMVHSILGMRGNVFCQIVGVNMALGDEEMAEKNIVRVDKFHAMKNVYRCPERFSREAIRAIRKKGKWIDEPNLEFYKLVATRGKDYPERERFYSEGLYRFFTEVGEEARESISRHRENLERFKQESSASLLG